MTFRFASLIEEDIEKIVFFRSMYNKQLLGSVFVISRIIKVSVKVISRSRTPTSTLIILDITKTSSNNCLINLTRSLAKKEATLRPLGNSLLLDPPPPQSFPCLSLRVWMFLELHIVYHSALSHDDNRDRLLGVCPTDAV